MVTTERLVTVEEFEAFLALEENSERRFELISGEIIEKVPTPKHGIITANIATEINLYLRQNSIGYVGVEIRHRSGNDEENDRLPDVSFIGHSQPSPLNENIIKTMPDLAIEVKSPTDTYKKMVEKAEFYLANGSRMVWLFYPEKRLIEVLTLDDRQLLGEDDELDGGDVLPGFKVRVKDFFPD
jgi:Uma2 family endonuclease